MSEPDQNQQIAIIQSEAEAVFGTAEKAEKWLNRFNPALGTTPIDFLKNPNGIDEVRKILSAIAHGGAA